MWKGILFLSIAFYFTTGCNQSNSIEKENENTDILQNAGSKKLPAIDSLQKKGSLEGFVRILHAGGDTLTEQKHINGFGDKPELSFSIVSGKMMHAMLVVKSDSANIRINQIEMPDGKFDGPFGREMRYEIKIPGVYKIIIGENMMAEGKWTGDFLINVWME